jgi:hypothetical protein
MNFLRRKPKINSDQPSTPKPVNTTAPTDKTKTNSRKSTLKQEKFIEGVIRHGNASKAAREAGYSPRHCQPQPPSPGHSRANQSPHR